MMHKVAATDQSRKSGIKIAELGRVASPGEIFYVNDSRLRVLRGDNKYRMIFVVELRDNNHSYLDNKPKSQELYNKDPLGDFNNISVESIEEDPEVFILEPGKEPIKVDENLNPIKEEKEAVVKKTTKGRKRVKKEEAN